MKRWVHALAVIGTALLFGCGDAESVKPLTDDSGLEYVEDSGFRHYLPTEESVPASPPGDFGQARQALNYLDGFGVMNGQVRCWTNGGTQQWSGACRLPTPGVKVWLDMSAGDCSSNATYQADFQAAFDSAANYMIGEFRNAGKSISRDRTSMPPSGQFVTIKVRCSTTPHPGSGATSEGSTAQMTSTLEFFTCTNTSAGKRCNYADTDTRVYKNRITGNSTWTGAVQSKRRTFIFNVVAHEIGHAFGLGHDACGPNPLADLMGTGACQTGGNPQAWYQASLRSFERDMLAAYSP
jgi:hypothetical protein